MNVAVIGGGVVGRAIANVLAAQHTVHIFAGSTVDRRSTRHYQSQPVFGQKCSFPEFRSPVGSMSVWGGVLAVPGQSLLDEFGIRLDADVLVDEITRIFSIEHCYGTKVGPLQYLFKVARELDLAPGVVELPCMVKEVRVTADEVNVVTDDAGSSSFDYCFLAGGSGSVPVMGRDCAKLVEPGSKVDKLISLTDRKTVASAVFASERGLHSLSVPMDLPIRSTSEHKRAVFHHILSRAGLFSPLRSAFGYMRYAFAFGEIVVHKLLGASKPFWFNTWVGYRDYPLKLDNSAVTVDRGIVEQIDGDVCMPALHAEVRVPPESAELCGRVFTEYFSPDQPVIPFNPVALRFAKLLSAARSL